MLSLGQVLDQGQALLAQGASEVAEALYRHWLANHQAPEDGAVAFNLGVVLSGQGRLDDAVAAYRQALGLNSRLYQARINLGLILEKAGQTALAIAVWRDGALEPNEQTQLLNQIGRVLEGQRLLPQAEAVLRQSLALDPHQPAVVQHWAYLRARQCKWPVLQPVMGLDGEVRFPEELLRDVGPFAAMALCDEPRLLREIAENWVRARGLQDLPRYHGPAAQAQAVPLDRRIRIGYLSSDFRMHAVGMLAAPLLEQHDRSRFEVFALDDTPPGHEGTLRQRICDGVEHHVPLQMLSEPQAAEAIEALGLDVLVDLTGMTAGARLGILARKPAPRTVSYIGFMGTMGMEAVDHVLVDRQAMTPEMAPHFVEQALFHPACYQVNERGRDAASPPSRESQGLPPEAFVYCAFSNSYKVTPEVFGRWMDVLRQVPGSVLWLLADNESNPAQMRLAAQAHGIDADRLVFASRVSPRDYLARYACADVMLDTYPYGAGLTASDALWMGLPILTRPGQVLASRMAASLLTALGLQDELVCDSWDSYGQRAVEMGRQPARVRALREKLLTEGRASDLFDPQQWTMKWEQMVEQMVRP